MKHKDRVWRAKTKPVKLTRFFCVRVSWAVLTRVSVTRRAVRISDFRRRSKKRFSSVRNRFNR